MYDTIPHPSMIRVRNRWRLWGIKSINNISMRYIFISFTLLAMLVASILKVLNYINCSWWVITSPLWLYCLFHIMLLVIAFIFLFYPSKKEKTNIDDASKSKVEKLLKENFGRRKNN